MTVEPTPADFSRPAVESRSVLLVTLDSCRYDTFVAADAPNLKSVGPEIHRAQAPSHFTYASHMAMWVGVTPGIAELAAPYLNPKFAKFFRISHGPRRPFGPAAFELEGRNIVHGFGLAGYRTIGTGAVGVFNPATALGAAVMADFQRSFYPGWPSSVARQLAWIHGELDAAPGKPVFVFLNVAETHTPYWHEGAAWSASDNPCRPFQTEDRRADCMLRQRACLEHVDALIGPLLGRFADATVVVSADHGDCWGEDGVWEHSVSHPATLTVPLLYHIEPQIERARRRAQARERALAAAPRASAGAAMAGTPEPDRAPLTLDSVVALKAGLLLETIDEEVIILDPATMEYHSAGATGSRIIELIGDGRSVRQIVEGLLALYIVDRRTCAEEVLAFIRSLGTKRLLA